MTTAAKCPDILDCGVLLVRLSALISDHLDGNLALAQDDEIVFAVAQRRFRPWCLLEHVRLVHTISIMRRELFYWAAILFTYVLGIFAGNLLAKGSPATSQIGGGIRVAACASPTQFGGGPVLCCTTMTN
jgi:uncharacterized membrane-anchored protein